jgi:hypothetical protein
MKETVLGLGIIFLFAAVIVFPISIQSTKTPENHIEAQREFLVAPDWTISVQLNESEEMLVYFSRPNTGEQGPIPDGEDSIAYMFVDITDPHGGNTTFNISFTERDFRRIVDHNDGGLIVKNPQSMELGDIGGKTQYAGEYKVRVYTYSGLEIYYYPNGTTMRRLEISTVTIKTEYPYIAALPVSISLAVVGLVLVVWGARSPRRRTRTKKA